MKKHSWFLLLSVFLITVLLNIISWNSTAFSDWYVANVYPVWLNLYGRITTHIPFSVGEVMIAAGVVWIFFTILLTGMTLFSFILAKMVSGYPEKIYNGLIKLFRLNGRGFISAAVAFFMVQTLNCFILYHTSPFANKYGLSGKEAYSLEELTQLRDFVVQKANDLAGQVERDENGNLVHTDLMEEKAIASMETLGIFYRQLDGFYPKPKKMASSGFVSQQHMQGYFFPFSMEANYNKVMNISHMPATMCHELAHTKGFILEDEANLIGFLACISSDDPLFQYSGYLSVLYYIDNDYYEAVHKKRSVYNKRVRISEQVKRDNEFLTPEAWESVEEKAVVKTETVKKATSSAISASLVANGIEEGSLSYGKVVGLLLDYYGGAYREEYLVQGN